MSDKKKFERPKGVRVPQAVAAKWSPKVLDEGFVPFPKRLLRCLPLVIKEVEDLQVILSIVDYARPELLYRPSLSRLAFTAGMIEADFKARLLKMRDRGWVTVFGNDSSATINIDGLIRTIEELTDDEPVTGPENQPPF